MAEKLVRDLIPKMAPKHTFRVAEPDEMPRLLLDKLREEAAELLRTTPGSVDELYEASDVMDVADRLETLAPRPLRTARKEKNQAGAFWQRIVMRLEDGEGAA